MKSIMFPRYIYKLHSKDILSDKVLQLPFVTARTNDQVISISDSQVVRWLDFYNHKDRAHEMECYERIKKIIKDTKKKDNTPENKKYIKTLYDELNTMQFIPELINVVMDKSSDIDRMDGFSVNGMKYYRFIGSPNQVKKCTVMYCREDIRDYLNGLVENGRRSDYKIVPAKYEAYKALTLSGSYPVTNTDRILVVNDLITHFTEDVIYLDNSESDEPVMQYKTAEIELDESDGYGLISPEMAQIWSDDMHLDYLMSGCCIRYAFTKGMVATFDFKEFARVHNKRIVTDVWGKEHDIFDIDLVLTTSMLKLWSAYDSIDEYIQKCHENMYTLSVTKVTPKELDEVRTLNYQYIQSYNLTNEEIKELYSLTVNEIKDIIHYDRKKTLLFLKGMKITEENAIGEDDWIKAIQICPEMMNDPYVINRVSSLIAKKIKDAEIGILKAHGNYAIIVGDPYALCQHIFKLDVDNDNYGLLKSGEIYHQFWSKKNTKEVVCFRSPMSCHNNIRKMAVVENEDMNYWYRYCPNLMLLNCHDSFCEAENGCDKDSDILYTSDNKILINKFVNTPAIMCVQHSAVKKEITEDELRCSNKLSFGNGIGAITNRITSMYDLLCLYAPESKEYAVLSYRIMSGQLYQQSEIDKTKGVVTKCMPKYWYSPIKPKGDAELSEEDIFNNTICADKKPYFMRYIYPDLDKKYKSFVKTAERQCKMLFRMGTKELFALPEHTEEQKEWIEWYKKLYPVNDNGSTMNRLCHMVEYEFKGFKSSVKAESPFDYTIMKSNTRYDPKIASEIVKLYVEYTKRKARLDIEKNEMRTSGDEYTDRFKEIGREFKEKAFEICPNSKILCEIILDLCYTSERTKAFAWDICGEQIIENLLVKNNFELSYITRDDTGDIEFNGYRFSERKCKIVSP